jgi:3-deoxy-D-manno-oct-2-ulosonic acid (Kdo) hydroxylase
MTSTSGVIMAVISISLEALRSPSPEQSRKWCAELEAGDIFFFPQTPIAIPHSDIEFLLTQQPNSSSLHKNIAYKPDTDKLTGVGHETVDTQSLSRLHAIMRCYSRSVSEFLAGFLSPYEKNWALDYASFRPHEEEGRDLPLHSRNDLLHTDAFPTRPTYGARILRFFNNIHPSRTRDWVVSDPFVSIVRQFVPDQITARSHGFLQRAAKSVGRGTGLGALIPAIKRSPYDDFMIRFHNFLKENSDFQSGCAKYNIKFPSESSWMAFTDTVPHAVLAGQYALEQTVLVRPAALVKPEISPLETLQSLTKQALL